MPRLERCPLGLYVFFVLASSPTPSVQYAPLPHFGYNYFSPCPLGFEGPTMFLNLDLIYSTNVWEKWELNCFVCLRCRLSWKLLLYMQILPYPHPLPSFLTKKVTQRGFLLEAEEQSWPTEPLGCNVKGRRLKSMSYLCSVNKMGVCGFLKNSVSKWRSRWLYFGGGWDLWL